MPDLIIKPTATSGNKLILKDQAGGAVLTTGDSGATIANATLASTTTFPSGHLLNITHETTSWSGSAYTTGTTTLLTTNFTPLTTTNNILIRYRTNFQFYGNTNSNNVEVQFIFYHNGVKSMLSTTGTPDHITSYSVNNYNQAFHRTHQYTHEVYLPVTRDSAGHNVRTIHCTVTVIAGRFYIADEIGDNFIQIWEFA